MFDKSKNQFFLSTRFYLADFINMSFTQVQNEHKFKVLPIYPTIAPNQSLQIVDTLQLTVLDSYTGPNNSGGPQGTQGFTGAQGPTGPAGAQGTNGTNGTNGATGTQGPTGAPGSVGGANTQVLFNNNSTATGSANMTFNGSKLTVADLSITASSLPSLD